MQVLIIEDEELSQQELILQLKDYPEFNVVKCLESVEDSISYLQKKQSSTDLIFMDIELADGSCFEIFKSIEIEVPVIFLTAYNQYAVQAFKVNSIDYLLKPLNPIELKHAIQQFNKLKKVKSSHYQPLVETLSKNHKRILVQIGDAFHSIDFNEIMVLKSEDKYVNIYTNKGKKHLTNKTLNQLEAELPKDDFFRINRQFIVHIKAIKKVEKYLNNRLIIEVTFKSNEEIVVSRNRVNDFLSWMGK